jgi:hypothetical protein
MNSGRQAPHFSEAMLIPASLILSFFFFTLSALQVGLPGLLATREGGPTLFTVLLASLCVATHAWSRFHCRDTTSPRRIGRRV